MIPRLIHQTWKDDRIPDRFVAWSEGWRARNPGWQWTLWTDRMLLDFAWRHYPALLPTVCGYGTGVMRADAGRYMLLHHFGGVYCDLDTECLAPLDSLADEDRVVLCHEPPSHWADQAPVRGQPFLLFNGVMASPAGHTFWRHVLDLLPLTSGAGDVLDATGPCLLTGAYLRYPAPQQVRVDSCHLFCGADRDGIVSPPYRAQTAAPLARHHWAGTWLARGSRGAIATQLRQAYYRLRHSVTRGRFLDPAQARRQVDPAVLTRPLPTGDKIAILVPVRDAAGEIEPFLAELQALDHPKAALKLVFCEGDSVDGSWERLTAMAARHRGVFRDIVLTRHPQGVDGARHNRWSPRLQRRRRAALAAVRNHLIDVGLDAGDDWALWIDIDVWRMPRDIIARLTAAQARIVAPHCVKFPGGPTYDRNSFIARAVRPPYRYYKYIRQGLYQPPVQVLHHRLHMDGLRHSPRVELDGVGGTMLLVDASLHRGGLRFPELPYREHIETEGFGLLARDLGVGAVGLPQVEILHVPW